MQTNRFVEQLNNKSKSVKLSGRNLQELREETAPLAIKNKEMEMKLQQLKHRMSKEKEERRNSEGSRWTSGQSGCVNVDPQTNSPWKTKEDKLHKLSAGNVKIRVLTEEPLAAIRKSRLKGKICGQCEVKSAGLMCAECSENYCIGCFTRFHQKGAMKHHKIIPLKTDLQTHVTTHAVASCLQKAPNLVPDDAAKHNLSPSCIPKTSNTFNKTAGQSIKSPEKGTEMHSGFCQEERKTEIFQDDLKGPISSHLSGVYDEVESARSFQEAVKQWRGERSDGGGNSVAIHSSVSMSAKATQAEPIQNRDVQIGEKGASKGRLPPKVVFNERSLTYMERLILKKHRRTPVETLFPSSSILRPPSATNTEEETGSDLTAEEEDFRLYCASLFAVPVTRDKTDPQITPSKPCLFIDFLDETCSDIEDCSAAELCEKKTGNNSTVQSVQPMIKMLPKALCHDGSSGISHSFHHPTQQSRMVAVQPETHGKKVSPNLQASKSPRPVKSMSPESKPPVLPSTVASGTSHKSMTSPSSLKAATSHSPTLEKCKANHRSPHSSPSLARSQSDIFKPSQAQLIFSADALDSKESALAEDHPSLSTSTSFSLRSTCTVSPFSSTESLFLPKVSSPPFAQKDSDLVLKSEKTQSLPSKATPGSPKYKLMSPEQSTHFQRDSNRFLSNMLPFSAVSSKHSEESRLQLSAVAYKKTSPDPSFHASSAYQITTAYGDQKLLSPVSSDKSALLNVNQDVYLAFKMEEEDEEPIDSEDEMSSDSLNMASLEDEPQIQGQIIGEGSPTEEVHHVMDNQITQSGLYDSFYLNDVAHLDVMNTSEHPHCKSLHASQTSLWDSDLTESNTHLRPLSCAAEAILEICSVDPMGCEDPDLDTDMATHTLIGLEHERRFMAKEPWNPVFHERSCGSQDHPENRHLIRVTVGKEQEEEETAKTDRLSVLLLP
ncbi:zinc finger B-box domain-containing protein 1 isoform X2 [Gouania willdenowi]|uniref:zinc finger B-box domain-containing protein 1 isoform X2 n=1 Tax=Gouania willdenowi TaxID=441366 RepID=UPI001055BC33|nr:zinc finger B-box domain-containing protein 1 isoform X2 [Gouania willdenowi]